MKSLPSSTKCCGVVVMSSERKLALLALLPLIALGCKGGDDSEASADSGSAVTDASAIPQQELWHLPGLVDAISLRIDEVAMTFEWGLDGCDYKLEGRGRIESSASGWRLLPEGEAATFDWLAQEPVSLLTAMVNSGVLEVRGQDTGGGEISQDWSRGGLCPICELLGPSDTESCSAPYLGGR